MILYRTITRSCISKNVLIRQMREETENIIYNNKTYDVTSVRRKSFNSLPFLYYTYLKGLRSILNDTSLLHMV